MSRIKADSIPGYRLLKGLGKGGMGAVYFGLKEGSWTPVAIKVARPDIGEKGQQRLEREAQLLSRIGSPCLPRYVDYLKLDLGVVLVMEYIEGTPVDALLEAVSTPASRLDALRQVMPGLATALQALHAHEILHRDVKPANILVPVRGDAVLVDLGLAVAEDVTTLTRSGDAVGTPDYLPPEQVAGEGATEASDLYQAALIAYDFLVGRERRRGKAALEDAMARATRKFPEVRSRAPWVPKALAAWIDKALHPDPACRPPSRKHLELLPSLVAAATVESGSPTLTRDPTASDEFDATAALTEARRQRERQRGAGWTAPDPSPIQSPVPSGSGSLPAPRAQWAALALSVAGVALSLGGIALLRDRLPGPQVASRRAVFRPIEGSLVLVDGLDLAPALRLVAPAEAPLTPGPDGRPAFRISLPPDSAGIEAAVELDGERIALPIPGSPQALLRLALGPQGPELRAQIPGVAPLHGRLECGDETVEVRGDPALRFPASRLVATGTEGSLWLWSDPRVRIHVPVHPADLVREWGERLAVPDAGLAQAFAAMRAYDPKGQLSEVRTWDPVRTRELEARSPGLAALFALDVTDEDLRHARYRELVPYRHVEWMWRDDIWHGGMIASPILGGHLAMGQHSSLPTPGSGERLEVSTCPTGIRLGPEAGLRNLFGSRTASAAGPEEAVPMRFDRVPPGPWKAAELSVFALHGVGWSSLAVDLPTGRTLSIPLGEATARRHHRIPPRWLAEGIADDGSLTLKVRLERGDGYAVPGRVDLWGGWLRILREADAKSGP